MQDIGSRAPGFLICVILTVAACAQKTPAAATTSETAADPEAVATPASTTKPEVTAADRDRCAPQEFSKSIVSCCGLPSFHWDGAACIDGTMKNCGCVCAGPSCGDLFESLEDCQTAYADCSVE